MTGEVDKCPILVLPDPGANTLEILSLCKRTGQNAGWTREMLQSLQDDMLGGDRDNVMDVVFTYFTVLTPQKQYVALDRAEVS